MIFPVMLSITVVVIAAAFGVWLYYDIQREKARQEKREAMINDLFRFILAEPPLAQSVSKVPLMITRDMHQQLADLGYSREDRMHMTPETAHMILNPTPDE